MDNADYAENWVFSVQHDGKESRVVWAGFILEDGTVENRLIVIVDGEYIQRGDDVAPLLEAATAFRISQLQQEYVIDPFLILEEASGEESNFDLDADLLHFGADLDDLGKEDFLLDSDESEAVLLVGAEDFEPELDRQLKEAIVVLAERSFNQEFLGQYFTSDLYLQTVARILQTPEPLLLQLTKQLIQEERVGLKSSVLIPYSTYHDFKAEYEELTGHKDYEMSDFGAWWCDWCGAEGLAGEEPDAVAVPCVEDSYRGVTNSSIFNLKE